MAIFAFKKKMLSTAVAAAMLSGMAISHNVSAIHLAEDGVGQVLLAPYYTVQEGNITKFAIVNTRSDAAVKAKVVIRSKAQSTEVLDFICYLTPTDVCRFEIINEGGEAFLYSNDDSIKNGDKFASEVPAKIQLFDNRMKARDANDINEVGHVEVIGVYALTGDILVNGQLVKVQPGLSKYHLVPIFTSLRTYNDGQVYPGGYKTWSATPGFVQLTGSVDIVKADNSDRMGYRIPALAGSIGDNDSGFDPKTLLPFDGRVIANPTYDTSIKAASETAIGFEFADGAFDNTYEIETALATAWLKGTYEDTVNKGGGIDGTNLLVTFPTKYRHRADHVCTGRAPSLDEIKNAYYTPPFNPDGTMKVALSVYDNSENSVAPPITDWSGGEEAPSTLLYSEVNVFTPTWNYVSGAYKLAFDPVTDCDYGYGIDGKGVPALGMTYKWMKSGDKIVNSMLIPSAHD